MSKNNVSELDVVAANNADIAGVSILGTGLLSTADDSFRNTASFLAKWWDDIGGVNTVTGTGDAIAVTTPTVYTALKTGMRLQFIAGAANTTAATLNLDAIGAKALRKISGGTDVALVAGDIPGNKFRVDVGYDAAANSAAGAWIVLGAAPVSAATTSASGIVELATVAEALTGTDAVRAVTPAGLYYPTGHLFGLTLSNNAGDATNDIDIAVGDCRDSGDTANMVLASALGKQLDVAWAVGGTTGSTLGMLATGVAVANGTYHIFLIKRPDTGVVDVAADTSVTGANIATNTNAAYTLKRRIGSIVRTGAAIKAFVQDGDLFQWKVPAGDIAATNPGTSAVTRTLTLPTGIRVMANLGVGANGSVSTDNPGAVWIGDLSQTDTAPLPTTVFNYGQFSNLAAQVQNGAFVPVMTNTSAQVRSRVQVSSTGTILYISTLGWIDTRGRVN